ncbi:histidine kinase N-terminal 7TM domain-containing protein [uncultured Thermanaerothrix sp.]|uniref:histidine kinase N-terminal 7TM domain-containing protein n=1 Tax=uncultured Thermanaerothrix sp. TaxID=1195149 RepID=UPI0026155677|nr:histidine kinase N-terminal 7TM domain-containing protein [uncultured Thermanaerothrix sp.]
MLSVLITLNQILVAGVAITAFALLLYALAFNLRDRVARSFALILVAIVIIYTAEALASVSPQSEQQELWLRAQWVGIILLPASYLHFSDALLETTGKPSRGRRRFFVRLAYVISLVFLLLLPTPWFVGPLVRNGLPAPHLKPTPLTDFFTLCYALAMGISGYNLVRAFQRSTTSTGRRRMFYLLVGSIAPALGSFPYLLFGSALAARHVGIFWALSVLNTFLVGGLVVVMAYAVAFFGVGWPDRTVKSRLLKWIMRGPVTASLTLAAVTIVRRAGEQFGNPYSAWVPITMAATILLSEYLITLFFPLLEQWLFDGKDKNDLELLRRLETRLLTRNDLRQFLEALLAAVCDRLQVPGAYVAALGPQGLELLVQVGQTSLDNVPPEAPLNQLLAQNGSLSGRFRWGQDMLVPLLDEDEAGNPQLLGILGICKAGDLELDSAQEQALETLTARMVLALQDYRLQREVFESLRTLTTQTEFIQRLRAVGRYHQNAVPQSIPPEPADLTQWVREALSHYWGGPKLTQSPLLRLGVVQRAIEAYDGNVSNALRAVLKEAIERVRPEGERRFTAEWVLYNILELKFVQGKKVREVAARLAMSEADLYRKQKVAIEAVARALLEMEEQNQRQSQTS